MLKHQAFYGSCLAFIGGILFASFLPRKIIDHDFYFFCGAICALTLLIVFWQKTKALVYLFALCFFMFALWRYAFALPGNAPDKIWHYNGQTIAFRAVIAKEPDVRERGQKLELQARSLVQERTKNISGKVLLSTELYPEYAYGDELEIVCDLQAPEPFYGFDYDRYLARYNIYSVCYYPPKISKLDSDNLDLLQRFYKRLFSFRAHLSALLDRGMDKDAASLARAMILGGRNTLSQDHQTAFSASGISHVVSISGAHISVLSAIVMTFLLGIGLKRNQAFYFALLFLVLYLIIVGLPASAMRAGLMGFCVLWALKLGRINKLYNSLLLAAVILLMLNPFLLRDDIGFQLSFLAILGMLYVYPFLQKICANLLGERLSAMAIVRVPVDVFALTFAAQAFTAPITYYNFGNFSLIAPLANFLILWTLPFLMIFLLAGLPLAWLFPAWSALIFFPAKILLNYILLVAGFLGNLPFAAV